MIMWKLVRLVWRIERRTPFGFPPVEQEADEPAFHLMHDRVASFDAPRGVGSTIPRCTTEVVWRGTTGHAK
jgi:hypothetical protein